MSNDSESKEKGERMIPKSISIELSLWQAAQKKAGFAPLSAIIRALLRKWLRGEIELTNDDTRE